MSNFISCKSGGTKILFWPQAFAEEATLGLNGVPPQTTYKPCLTVEIASWPTIPLNYPFGRAQSRSVLRRWTPAVPHVQHVTSRLLLTAAQHPLVLHRALPIYILLPRCVPQALPDILQLLRNVRAEEAITFLKCLPNSRLRATPP